MKELIKLLKIEDKEIKDKLPALIESCSDSTLPLLKKIAKEEGTLAGVLKASDKYGEIVIPQSLDFVELVLHDYLFNIITPGNVTKTAEYMHSFLNHLAFDSIDFVGSYVESGNHVYFEPRDIKEWDFYFEKGCPELVFYARESYNHKDNGNAINAIDTVAKSLDSNPHIIDPSSSTKNASVFTVENDPGVHMDIALRLTDHLDSYTDPVRFSYLISHKRGSGFDGIVNPKSVIDVLLALLPKGSQLSFRFYGKQPDDDYLAEIGQILKE